MGGKMSSVSVLKLGLLPLRAAADVWRRGQIENSSKWPDTGPLTSPQ